MYITYFFIISIISFNNNFFYNKDCLLYCWFHWNR